MSLKERIKKDMIAAMKAKENRKRDALRMLSAAMKQIEVDERIELDDAMVSKIIQKQVKQRVDAAQQYKDAQREDLYEIEMFEISCFETYLPKQLSDEELALALSKIIADVGAQSMKDIGKVMGAASKVLSGSADGKRINACAKELLA